MATRKFSKKATLASTVESTLQELVAAAVCWGAVSHPTYTDVRKKQFIQEADARLKKAAAAYHSVVVERTAA